MPSRSGRLCQPDKLFSGLGNAGIATLPELAGHQTIGYLLAGLPQAIRQTGGQQ
ncbi:TPA: hypothetical protein I8Y13_004860 [Raoultella planticola]|nr:hypothetical protein [Raoultella planticola]HAT1676184.1 hypothetical protein [Raoultella planticola]